MLKFKLLESTHQASNGNVYGVGDVFPDKVDLAAIFPGRFEAVGPKVPETCQEVVKTPVVSEVVQEEPAKVVPEETTVPDGDEVTSDFPKAVEHGFRVFKIGKTFTIFDAENLAVPLNEKPLKKALVEDFIENFISEE